jgi:hypothetical protein
MRIDVFFSASVPFLIWVGGIVKTLWMGVSRDLPITS